MLRRHGALRIEASYGVVQPHRVKSRGIMSGKLRAIVVLVVGALIVTVGAKKFAEYKQERDAFNARANAIQKARQQVLVVLKDPQSVQLRNEKWVSKDATLCGEINAKNSLGGYVGFKKFIATPSDFLLEGAGLRTAKLDRFKSISWLSSSQLELIESDPQEHKFLANDIFGLIWKEACSGESESL